MPSPADCISTYIDAKDRNRPHLLGRAFAATASVEVVANTPTISFPSAVTGLDAIAETFVRRFAMTYENVYTFCLSPPPDDADRTFSCDWLVCMSEKQGGALRAGCGRYDWFFARDARLIERLVITIDVMQTLDPVCLRPVMDWVAALPYPWCPAELAARQAPKTVDLAETLHRLGRASA